MTTAATLEEIASIAFPDPESWIELPGTRARIHRSDLSPCRECGARYFSVVEIRRETGLRDTDGSPILVHSISIECPRCPLASRKKQDRTTVLARLDTHTGTLHDARRTSDP